VSASAVVYLVQIFEVFVCLSIRYFVG